MNQKTNDVKTEADGDVANADLLAASESYDMVGVWENGTFTIEWHDEDHVKVTKHWREFDEVAILNGGDFETILETLFTGAVVTRVRKDSSANAKEWHGYNDSH